MILIEAPHRRDATVTEMSAASIIQYAEWMGDCQVVNLDHAIDVIGSDTNHCDTWHNPKTAILYYETYKPHQYRKIVAKLKDMLDKD